MTRDSEAPATSGKDARSEVRPAADAKTPERQRWLATLAKASREDLEALSPKSLDDLIWRYLRPPEIGMVMLRGRSGGDGAPFNLGETSVTRCAVQLDHAGRQLVGHGYVLGRDKRHAQLIALLDALLQHPDDHDRLASRIIAPLAAMQAATRKRQAGKAEATKVNFFTLVRGDG
ncbi:phosphonate C-P lyase system protein PhnG [Algihabitans albus]|uniref:phosphonate C-P lyase system protein PhnG n=1 Tax=Algihabitans albus TaxID=2164067 RepID=UPI000E5D3578|nr:phosphonate C-P lyase system protein PhnG [Algihabitans albus]